MEPNFIHNQIYYIVKYYALSMGFPENEITSHFPLVQHTLPTSCQQHGSLRLAQYQALTAFNTSAQ